MIADLDETLRRLLVEELPVKNGEIEIEFDQPKREWSARLTRPTVNLFLYDVRENATLRQHRWEQLPDADPQHGRRKRAPYRVDCYYLITAWAAEPEDEHRLLSRTLMALFRFPVLPEERLVGMMQGQPFEIQTQLAKADRLTNPAEIWSALDNEVRPTIPYIVTVALDPWAEVTEPLVSTLLLRTGIAPASPRRLPFIPAAQAVTLGGTVRDAEGNPQPGIQVALKGTGHLATTDEAGRFLLSLVAPGNYTLLAWPPEGKPRQQEIEVLPGAENGEPAANGYYDITL
jgi:hypothetical protein